jgi:hypothetical protein
MVSVGHCQEQSVFEQDHHGNSVDGLVEKLCKEAFVDASIHRKNGG